MNIEVIHVYKEKRHYKEVEDTSINGYMVHFMKEGSFSSFLYTISLSIFFYVIFKKETSIQRINTEKVFFLFKFMDVLYGQYVLMNMLTVYFTAPFC